VQDCALARAKKVFKAFLLTLKGKRNIIAGLSLLRSSPLGDQNQLLRRLPSVDAVLSQADLRPLVEEHPRQIVVSGIRIVIEAKRKKILAGEFDRNNDHETVLAAEVAAAIEVWNKPVLQPVINATGVVVHTNLGRSPLSKEVAQQAIEIACGYSNLELDLATGKRGSRMDTVREILVEISGAEDALVVNNNAAAVYLGLRVLAAGREVIVSRGELVEIGGSFRIPDVMTASGAKLVEVGTTNKTKLSDYQKAIGPDTALILKVHRSNFEMVGFTEDAPIDELVALAGENRIPLLMDMGWGTLADDLPQNLGHIQIAKELLAQGVDLVCFSGDKILGGPQSGIILGKKDLISSLARDPMARALRVGKLTLAALWSTVALYRGGFSGAQAIPVVKMLYAEPKMLQKRAEKLLQVLKSETSAIEAEVIEVSGQVGGGAMPMVELPSFAVAVSPKDKDVEGLVARLRRATPAVLARVYQERVVFDVRTVINDQQLDDLAGAICAGMLK
jgi:L-seryl-tRNA(Ser) seleniumtransferase